jgi:hypothetical protein
MENYIIKVEIHSQGCNLRQANEQLEEISQNKELYDVQFHHVMVA